MASSSTSSGPSRHHLLTAEEKTACISLRSAGWKLPKIAAHLGLNYDTIYKFCKSGSVKVMVWGCFIGQQRGPLIRMPSGKIKGKDYMKIMEEEVFVWFKGLSEDSIWMQDNAPIHQSAYSKQGFKLYDIKTMTWPPQSPDLNPIENLWAFLKHRLYKGSPHLYLVQGGPERTKKAIFEALLQAWETIEEDYLGKLLESMPRRMEAVIKAKGGQTRF